MNIGSGGEEGVVAVLWKVHRAVLSLLVLVALGQFGFAVLPRCGAVPLLSFIFKVMAWPR